MIKTLDTRVLDFFDAIIEMPEIGDGTGSMDIVFHTRTPGVSMPPYLSDQYPLTMRVVLEHAYHMSIGLRAITLQLFFDGKPETIVIPLEAVVDFKVERLPDEDDMDGEYDTSNVISLFSGKELKF